MAPTTSGISGHASGPPSSFGHGSPLLAAAKSIVIPAVSASWKQTLQSALMWMARFSVDAS